MTTEVEPVVLPMFPLGVAHLPGDDVVLRVFEPRYVSMFRGMLSSEGPAGDAMVFGSALILRGSEVGGGDQRASRGVVVRVGDIAATAEGGYVVVGRAELPIRVLEWLPDDPHPRALTVGSARERLDDLERLRSLERLARAAQMTRLILVDAARASQGDLLLTAEHRARLGVLASGHLDDADPREVFWLLARSLPCGPTDRLAMLSEDRLMDRIETFERVAEHVREVLAFRLSGD